MLLCACRLPHRRSAFSFLITGAPVDCGCEKEPATDGSVFVHNCHLGDRVVYCSESVCTGMGLDAWMYNVFRNAVDADGACLSAITTVDECRKFINHLGDTYAALEEFLDDGVADIVAAECAAPTRRPVGHETSTEDWLMTRVTLRLEGMPRLTANITPEELAP